MAVTFSGGCGLLVPIGTVVKRIFLLLDEVRAVRGIGLVGLASCLLGFVLLVRMLVDDGEEEVSSDRLDHRRLISLGILGQVCLVLEDVPVLVGELMDFKSVVENCYQVDLTIAKQVV